MTELKPTYRGKLITFVAVREGELTQASLLADRLQTEGWQLCSATKLSQCQSEKALFLFPEKEVFTPYQQATFVRRLTVAHGLKEITIITTSHIILADAFGAKDVFGENAMRNETYYGAPFLVKRDLNRTRSYADKHLQRILASDDLGGYSLAELGELAEQIGGGHYAFELRRRIRVIKETTPPACPAHRL